MTTTAVAPTVIELAAHWNASATTDELAQVAKSTRAFASSHGYGILTTEELRSVYRHYVQEGWSKRSGMFFALAVGVQQAAQVPAGSLNTWEAKVAAKAQRAAAAKAKRAAAAAARKAAKEAQAAA